MYCSAALIDSIRSACWIVVVMVGAFLGEWGTPPIISAATLCLAARARAAQARPIHLWIET
jgi:hypothetical protein